MHDYLKCVWASVSRFRLHIAHWDNVCPKCCCVAAYVGKKQYRINHMARNKSPCFINFLNRQRLVKVCVLGAFRFPSTISFWSQIIPRDVGQFGLVPGPAKNPFKTVQGCSDRITATGATAASDRAHPLRLQVAYRRLADRVQLLGVDSVG